MEGTPHNDPVRPRWRGTWETSLESVKDLAHPLHQLLDTSRAADPNKRCFQHLDLPDAGRVLQSSGWRRDSLSAKDEQAVLEKIPEGFQICLHQDELREFLLVCEG